ncbi:polysaccharide deacetylase family protein [candidate division WOR-3 bacterium]|nr:polysaccharide deacetylase family protein [candidate division WOR-3 bacterium]
MVGKRIIAITVDVETDWGGRAETIYGIDKELPIILNVLKTEDVPATFFISGQLLMQNKTVKKVILKIANDGHEIASHGMNHNLNYSGLSYNKLFKQISESKRLLENIFQEEVIGFRSPQCRVNKDLYKALSQAGYKYDSSVVSKGIFPGRYSGVKTPIEPFVANGILEIPITTIPHLRMPLGLLWINAMGIETFKFISKVMNFTDISVLYLHPFDLLFKKIEGNSCPSPSADGFGPLRWSFSEASKRVGVIVNKWYNFKTANVVNTFTELIKYLKREGHRFLQLRDIYENCLKKT